MTQQPCRLLKSRGRHARPNCIPASAVTATNWFRRARHSATADTDPKTRANHSTHGRSRSRLFSNISPARRANWHRASSREVTNRKEYSGPGFRDRIVISCTRRRGNRSATRDRHCQGLLFPKISMLPGIPGEDPAWCRMPVGDSVQYPRRFSEKCRRSTGNTSCPRCNIARALKPR